jgi:hypothetical protein
LCALIRFLADMQYLARMDVFLGSHSNMYPAVVAVRRSWVLLSSHVYLAYTPPAIECTVRQESVLEAFENSEALLTLQQI